MEDWVETEFTALDLGDERLNKRAKSILSTFGFASGKTIPQAFESWAETKACY